MAWFWFFIIAFNCWLFYNNVVNKRIFWSILTGLNIVGAFYYLHLAQTMHH